MSEKVLLVLNDPPYGTERSYNGLRIARSLARADEVEVRVFLLGDGVGCAMVGQKVPDGYYNLERMMKRAIDVNWPMALYEKLTRF